MTTLADVLGPKTKSTRFALPNIEPTATFDWNKPVNLYAGARIQIDPTKSHDTIKYVDDKHKVHVKADGILCPDFKPTDICYHC